MQGSFSNIPYAFFHENRNGQDNFMPTPLLKESFGKTLGLFPLLFGHLKSIARGKIQITVDPQRINVPEFGEAINNNITFADIRKAKFDWTSWPENVAIVGAFATADRADGEIKLLNVHVVRLKDNTGLILIINCPHYVFDGAGYFAFVKQWASIMDIITLGKKFETITEFCPDNLSGLRESMREYLPEDSCISENDLLVALVSRTVTQSQEQPIPKAGWFSATSEPESHFTVRIPCDARPRLGVKEKYTGNLLIPLLVREPMQELLRETTPETLANSALQVRTAIGNISSRLISQFHKTVTIRPTSYMRPLAFAASHTTTSMVTTSQVKFGLYDADFGSGRPQFVCLTPLFAGAYPIAAFLPPPPGVEGVYVLMTANKDTMSKFVEIEYWKKITTLVW